MVEFLLILLILNPDGYTLRTPKQFDTYDECYAAGDRVSKALPGRVIFSCMPMTYS